MVDKCSFTPVKSDKLISNNSQSLVKNNGNISQKFSNVKSVDVTSRLGQFAWRQIPPSTISLPVIFRHHHREEYLCVQLINIHLLSKFPSETVSYCMKQSPIHYFSLTEYEAKLFQCINKFHSNGYLSTNNNNQLDYSRLDLAYITPFIPFLQFYQFISANSQPIKNNGFWISPKKNQSNTDIERQHISDKYSSDKMISSTSNEQKSNNSYCRSILFHGKEIISYSTTSSLDSAETILCLSIKDIVLTYFPLTTPEEFLQLCRLKQIVRFKPDKSTNTDSSLRLINMHQLDQHWDFFIQQLTLNTKPISSHQSELNQCNNEKTDIIESLPLTTHSNADQPTLSSDIIESLPLATHSNADQPTLSSDIIESLPLATHSNADQPILSSDIIEQSSENISKIDELSSNEHLVLSHVENPPCEIDSIQLNDNESIHFETDCSMDQQIEITQENLSQSNIAKEQNELNIDLSENKQEEEVILSTMENKTIKKKRRRRSQKYLLTLKRRKQKELKNDNIQWWINKYSIEPIIIRLQRANLPID